MSATEAVEMELGRTGGDEESCQLPVVSCQSGAEPELTEEQVKKLSAFITDRPKSKAPKTAKEKRLAKQRKLVGKSVG